MMTTICINNTNTFKFDNSHTLEEWQSRFGKVGEFWDFPIEELLDGTIEPNDSIVYWLIDGRLYETDIEV